MSLLEEVTRLAALGAGAAALAAGALALAVTRRPLPALAVLLDLLLAAGLLRLIGDPGWQTILTAAAIVALRRLLSAALRVGRKDGTAILQGLPRTSERWGAGWSSFRRRARCSR